MLEFRSLCGEIASYERPRVVEANPVILLSQAMQLFNRARWHSALRRIKCTIFQQANFLLDLDMESTTQVTDRHYSGIHPIQIDDICGTIGHRVEFDRCFYPRTDRIRERWLSIAIARLQYIPLEPIALVHLNPGYYVADGHHRISVARALGETAIDAEVIIWDINFPHKSAG